MTNSSWFTTAYDYSGPAEVVFENPHAEFYGPAAVGPDEHGKPTVEVTVERSAPTISDGFDLAEIQLGSHTHPDGVKEISLGGGAWNRASVAVSGKAGIFKGAPSWEYTFSDYSPDSPLTLRLTPVKSDYTTSTTAREKFMVLPLSNFVTKFPKPSTVIRRHPLCVTGEGDSETTGCITFQVNGELAFIQQLRNVDDGAVGIKPWNGEIVLTAIAVIPTANSAMTNPWGWFLNLILGLLDLASGSPVGTPWIEVRDENGNLVRRSHFAINQGKPFVKGYRAIQQTIHWQNGEFLTAALSSTEAREQFFSVALRHCARAGLPGLTLDDQLVRLVRAFECLWGCPLG